ncbi:hypothetical protein FQR65_LT01201 [Abscondita terminalis]|nr:hypothetical protein FQR65_LT01201 [Abscondita terminalis]
MDFADNSPLLCLFNLGKLFLVFEKIYSLKRENDLLKKNAIKIGDQNVDVYQSNSVKLETITTEILKKGKTIYDKLNNKHKTFLKPYLHTFKMTTVERPLCSSTANGFPYCTCNLKHKTYLQDLYDLYNQLKIANESLRSVKSINKNLKKELGSLSIEFGALRTQIFDYNCSVEMCDEGEEHICINNKDCREKIKSYMNEANETISECLDMAMSETCDCSIEKCSGSREQDIVSVQITEIINENEKNPGENVVDEINITVTKSQILNETKHSISKQNSQDSIYSSESVTDKNKTEEKINDDNAKKEISDQDESENNDSEQYDEECEVRNVSNEIQVEIMRERKTVKNNENVTDVNETDKNANSLRKDTTLFDTTYCLYVELANVSSFVGTYDSKQPENF